MIEESILEVCWGGKQHEVPKHQHYHPLYYLLEMQIPGPHARLAKSEAVKVEPSNLYFYMDLNNGPK